MPLTFSLSLSLALCLSLSLCLHLLCSLPLPPLTPRFFLSAAFLLMELQQEDKVVSKPFSTFLGSAHDMTCVYAHTAASDGTHTNRDHLLLSVSLSCKCSEYAFMKPWKLLFNAFCIIIIILFVLYSKLCGKKMFWSQISSRTTQKDPCHWSTTAWYSVTL